jgi:AcrR family transcriptional regulator
MSYTVRIVSSTLYGVSTPESQRPGGEPIWTRPEPGARKPRFTREQIAAAAMAVADAEGVDAVTMRRVADALGAGTMTLYHYVRSKDELIALVVDQMMGELLIPDDEMPDDWREAFAAIGRRSREAFRRHGWIHEMIAKARPEDAQVGGNGLRHFEQSLRAAALTGLPADAQLELLTFVDDYVFGYSMRERGEQLAGPTEETEHIYAAIFDYIEEQLRTGEFPHVEALVAGRSPREFFEETLSGFMAEERFERGLERILDGIAREIERRG